MKLNQDLNSLLNSLHTGHKSVLHLRYVLPFSPPTILAVFIRLALGPVTVWELGWAEVRHSD